jgi:nitrogen fixation protein FixH
MAKGTPGEFTGRHMLAAIIGFFAVVVGANAVLAVVAAGSWTGLVARNGYVESQRYNEVLADARGQQRLGWRGELEAGAGGLVFKISDSTGRPLPGLAVAASLGRPTNEAEDRAVELDDRGGGLYAADGGLAAGAWNVEVTARDGAGRRYRRIFRLWVREDG